MISDPFKKPAGCEMLLAESFHGMPLFLIQFN